MLGRKLSLARVTWRGATWGALFGVFALWLVEAVPMIAVGAGNAAVWLVLALVTAGLVLAGFFAGLLLRWLGALPPRHRWIVGTALALAVTLTYYAGTTAGSLAIFVSGAVVLGSVAGGALGSWFWRRRRISVAVFAAAALGLLFGLRWFLVDGNDAYVASPEWAGDAKALDAEDPSKPGGFAVKTLTYGSGSDQRRPEFGTQVAEAFRTASVDGSKLVEQWTGAAGWARTRYWGFDAKHMPLQARVWYPDGAGPFPLVLVVHGNHDMEEYSDPGYAYLGELMASRGFIVASVDENFINGSVASNTLGIPEIFLQKETDARAWILLEHLRTWKAWNAREGHPFFGRVDMHQIALIGHSRGGEAVSVAAAFNRLPYNPDDANLRFDYGFDIRTVIAIAPVDGQIHPAGRQTEPRNVNYFVLQGTEDGDMLSFHGSRQLERIKFTDERDWCKTSLYIRGANHGQFNTVWGRSDLSGFGGHLLNLRGIMPAEAQRQVAKTTISAFLEATLHGRSEYLALFRDTRTGRNWLPPTDYRNKFEDSTHRFLATYEEDIDLTTTTAAGGSARGENLDAWGEQWLKLTWGDLDTSAVVLGWNAKKETPSYTLSVPAAAAPKKDDVLVFAMGNMGETPATFTVELVNRGGEVQRTVPLRLAPPIVTNVYKASFAARVPKSELVFQSFEVPVNGSEVEAVRFVFDPSVAATVALDDVGVRTPRQMAR
ncbi:hypothetical protein LVJ94_28980 [Pendulispora rubella]|uniref:Alpha/beta hydrolase n=1 Tax=Pendulispora rubella TaxID=2741070 RepID=A0ABZ2KSC2_9BACT